MTSIEIRQAFLDFFEAKQHRIVQSAPVVPHADPTLLFTNAGMNQFKDVFLGINKRDYTRCADTQKCIRVSGKHNDLEEVGIDTYHHTFFEMLGNWSFGDYYKKEAIEWAWELLTQVWKLPVERLHATVFRTDDEAYQLWTNYLPKERIHRFDEKDNFWEMGETGPCGPCSEIHFDRTPDLSGGPLVNAGVTEVIEIWNLVFIQYNRKPGGTLEELTSKHVDTGMGFERLCAVIQGKSSNYDTDVFMPLINKIEQISNKEYTFDLTKPDDIAMRVIADHIRTLSFAIADGALPSNEGRGYVLRRILRRGSRFARNIGITEPVLYRLLPTLCDTMGDIFPELIKNKNIIERVIKAEEESFLQTLENGLNKFEDIKHKAIESETTEISGSDAFLLYDSFGFPLDLTELLARENNMTVNRKEFDEQMQQQKDRSRKARKVMSQEVELPLVDASSTFTGYENLEEEAEVLFVNENLIVTDKTPFYAESGGQVSDTGEMVLAGEKYIVLDVKKSGNAIVHVCDREIENLQGEKALLKVDTERRKKIMRNHSVTHLLHEALYRVLGAHIKQAGSLVAPDYLRFDFNHFEKVSDEDLQKVENIVNSKILQSIQVKTDVLTIDEAKKNPKAKMFFGDKYGDIVRVITMDSQYSTEFCGGTHVKNTAEIGLFKIISESSIAAGVRRIEAITGDAVLTYINSLMTKIDESKNQIDALNGQIRQFEKEITSLKQKELSGSYHQWLEHAKLVDGVRVVVKEIQVSELDALRTAGEQLRDAFGKNGIGLLATIIDGKIQLCCVVTDDLKGRFPAGKLVGEAAKKVGGGGGGKPHLATAGGRDVEKLSELFEYFPLLIASN